ncbi:recombinase [Herbihabitans rhizosphaerae]|uniref:Recombinase n=1 Tax=Herbihabitans rhizosphaerae TaxID=1872711 RepID=A0A4Q7KEP5_9PSEU|nr:recombinase family protein [Herbihabitans rhizosphaerae]RZS30520.1 recombinase [Herbihabitans rhizosphaerae]
MPPTKDPSPDTVKRAVYLLRVSTPRQMRTATDIDPEGNSIPTQRESCDSKCKDLRAVKVDEYVEPGYSAQSIEKRPIFKDMLRRIDEQGDVDYVIIYARSRVFRNYIEAAVVKQQLDKRGVKLVSANANEDFGEGYMAEAMEAIVDVFNWVQIRQSGDDISKKMLNKARNGGTNGVAKLGYLNTTTTIDGYKVNTVTTDPERSHLITMAFELVATGEYPNVEQIRDILTDAGLRMPRTGRPVSVQTLWLRLRDRYYCGYVTFKGIEYPGRHQPLISEELFDRVQRVLDTHSGSGTRQGTHPHYLKGTIWCRRCTQRFMVQRAQGNGGTYYYFFCGGRQDRVCDQPYIPVDVIEDAVTRHYATITLPDDVQTQMREAINDAAATATTLPEQMRTEYAKRLDKLDAKERYLLDLAAEEGWPKDTLRDKIADIRTERTRITSTLRKADTQLDDGKQILTLALDILADPHTIYLHATDTDRAILNKTIFSKIYIDGGTITGHELNEPFNHLMSTTSSSPVPQPRTGQEDDDDAAPPQGHDATNTSQPPEPTLSGQGSSKTHVVGSGGVEPVTLCAVLVNALVRTVMWPRRSATVIPSHGVG